ncbi:unnamed protein product [Nesidiocoris tenuis]|uniref:Cation/H+ exchanger transmembrane domain-containing protein n=1 Tax=Nesidiocoris tenuis TaxID=355587 RepID=A0A6H5GV76_9HEMI|nr:unnamed protein product [Nesidiocoris tenuis]
MFTCQSIVKTSKPFRTRPSLGIINCPLRISQNEGFYLYSSHSITSPGLPRADRIEQTGYFTWWYLFCTKCRRKETGPGWEPPHYQLFCPYPFCPTYRHIARVISLIIIGLLAWGVIYLLFGADAAPGGQLFGIAALCIAANFGGWVFRMINLPPLVGMLLIGAIFQNLGYINVSGAYTHFASILRKIALVLILTRAGLDLDGKAMKKLAVTVLKTSLVPWMVEASVVMLLSVWLFGLPWMWGILLGVIVAAVSPAVVVPCLMRIRSKGYGVAKGIPTLIIAISGIDDALSVAAFGIISSIMFSGSDIGHNIALGPLSIIMGVAYGVVWGCLANFLPERGDVRAPWGVVVSAFLCCVVWTRQGWELEDNPVAEAYEIFWMIFEPILFGLTGTQIKIDEMSGPNVTTGLGIIIAACLIRMVSTVLVCFGSKLNHKEKVFCALSWMAKASVQAALAPVAMELVHDRTQEERDYAAILLLVVVMSIVLTAPLGAIIITFTGKRLLTKTEEPIMTEGWRRSARPSLRDISIINEEPDPDYEIRRKPSIVVNQASP